LSNFKITHVSMVVVGSTYFRFGIFLEWVLGTVLRDDRDVSLHLHVSRVVDRIHRVFVYLFWGFIWEICGPFEWSQPPADAGVVLFCLFWTVWSCIYIYYCFVYDVVVLFYSFSLLYAPLTRFIYSKVWQV
jgi:hypothetical protein